MTERAAFGLELQRTRERRGLTLDQLAECTKISASLFAGLERGDVSRWPAGIFRRAFVRSYAQAVGLDPEDTVVRFLRLYPHADDEAGASPCVREEAAVPSAEGAASTPRAVREPDRLAAGSPVSQSGWRRVGAAALDVLLAALPALVIALLFGWPWFWLAAAGLGLVGHVLIFSLTGSTPGARLLLPKPAPRAAEVEEEVPAVRRRPEVELSTVSPARRRQARHVSSPARPVAATRSRRMQH